MTRNDLLLCGMHATGDILSEGGSEFLMSLYFTILASPALRLLSVSFRRVFRASVDRADLWGPCRRADSMRFRDQAGPQFAGQPSVAYLWSSAAAGWLREYKRGHIWPLLPIFSGRLISGGMVSDCFRELCTCEVTSFGVIASGGGDGLTGFLTVR